MKSYGRPNVGRNLLALIYMGASIIVFFLIVENYGKSIEKSKNVASERLKSIISMAALAINGDLHETFSQECKEKNGLLIKKDSAYAVLRQTLKEIHEVNHLNSPIYTLAYDPLCDDFRYVVTSAAFPHYKNPYKGDGKVLKAGFYEGGISEVGVEWLSAFAPLRNSKNEVVALICIDQNYGDSLREERSKLFTHLLIAIIFIVPTGLIIHKYANKISKAEEILLAQNEKIRTQKDLINQDNKELEAAVALIKGKNETLDTLVQDVKEQLNSVNEDLHSFLYRSYHDIQGPIATLHGISQLALMEVKSSLAKHYVSLIDKTTTKLSHRIRDIHALYEIKNKELRKKDVDLQSLMKGIEEEFAPQLKNGYVRINSKIPEGLSLDTDEYLLKTVIKSLINHSLLHHERTDPADPKIRIYVSEANEKTLRLSIEDNTLNLNRHLRKNICDLFENGDKRAFGLDLGLIVAKMGMDKIHAQIKLLSLDTSGTLFQITFNL